MDKFTQSTSNSKSSSKASSNLHQIKAKSKKNIKELNDWKKSCLHQWMETHQKNPYPTEKQKLNFAVKLGMSKRQIDNWFVNTRKRYYQDNQKVKKTKRKANREPSVEINEDLFVSSNASRQTELPKIQQNLDLQEITKIYCICNIPNLVDFVQIQDQILLKTVEEINNEIKHYQKTKAEESFRDREISRQTSTKSISINIIEIL